MNCPTCGSPAPERHPAVQHEGEVQPCRDPFHLTVTPENTEARIAETQALIRKIYPDAGPSLRHLVAERDAARAACKAWEDAGEWENAPADVIQRSIDADRSLLAWFDENDLGAEYERGFLDGIAAYAYSSSEPWAENGVQYVGTTGTTLAKAKAQVRQTWNYAP